MKTRKKAQIQTQIFMYSLMLIVVGLVLVYGYNAIKGFTERSHQIELLQFQEDIKNMVDSQNHEYMSVVKKELVIPQKYNMIVMIDLNYPASLPLNLEMKNNFPIVFESWESSVENNVFLIGDNIMDSFNAGTITLNTPDHNLTIVPSSSRLLELRLTGLGGKTQIEKW